MYDTLNASNQIRYLNEKKNIVNRYSRLNVLTKNFLSIQRDAYAMNRLRCSLMLLDEKLRLPNICILSSFLKEGSCLTNCKTS